jgi:hypothetical protein
LSDQAYYQRTQTGERAVEFVDGTRFGGTGAAVVFAVPIATGERIDGAAIGVLDEQILRELFAANASAAAKRLFAMRTGNPVRRRDV